MQVGGHSAGIGTVPGHDGPEDFSGGGPADGDPRVGARWATADHREALGLGQWLDLSDASWPKMWLFAGLEHDLAEPGEYLVLNMGDESLLVSANRRG